MHRQPFTTSIWAEEIKVGRKSQTLIVTGKNHTAVPVAGVAVEADLLAQSIPLARWPENRRKKPPHVEFANATTDAKLIEFVRRWGPVDGSPYAELGSPDSPRGWKVVVRRSLRRLRLEQKTFSGAARLISEIQSKRPDPERVFKYYAQLPVFAERESFFPTAVALNKGQSLARAACQYAQIALCRLLDRFPPRLYPTTAGPVELLPLDTRTIGKGVKDVLYGMLRLEYMRVRRQGLSVCPYCDEV